MADFSMGYALGSGFSLIRTRPGAILAWGLTYLLIGMVLPLGMALWVMGPEIPRLVASFSQLQASTAGPPPEFMVFQSKMMLVQPVTMLAPLIAQTILAAAVFRAVLEPGARSMASLRLGRRELWLGLTLLVAGILTAVALVAMELIGIIVGVILGLVFEAAHVDVAVRIVVFVMLGLALFGTFLAVAVRFSLALPMSFAEGQFRLFESWELTRGHAGKLFGLAVLVALISIVLAILFESLLIGALLLAAMGPHLDPAAFEAIAHHPELLWRPPVLAVGAVAGVVFALAMGAVFAINLAPWAVAYRELAPGARPEPREGGVYVPVP